MGPLGVEAEVSTGIDVVEAVTGDVTLLGAAVLGEVTLGVTDPGETDAEGVEVVLVSRPPPPGLPPEPAQP